MAQKTGKVHVLSASASSCERPQEEEEVILREHASVTYFRSFRGSNRICRLVNKIYVLAQLFFYIFRRINHRDYLIVYHSPRYMRLVQILKKVIGFYLLLEVEEIYGDVLKNKRLKDREIRYFKTADSYIFSTDLLEGLVNSKNKPSTVIYGVYEVCNLSARKNSTEVHLVYSGTFAEGKGAMRAVEAMPYLPNEYVLHLAGYGTDREIDALKSKISSLRPSVRDRIVYEGMLIGRDYDHLLSTCDIGLCTQDQDATYALTSFPSKVLNYLNHGLSVVATDIPPLRCSGVASCLQFYKGDNPANVACAINSVRINRSKNNEVICHLDRRFAEDFGRILTR